MARSSANPLQMRVLIPSIGECEQCNERRTMSSTVERYQKLGMRESLPRVHRYPITCKELSFILRAAYHELPKNLKSTVLDDTLAAFRLLPEMKTQSAVLSATLLAQAVAAALPKQKKNMVLTEFKHAKIAHKKQCKTRQEEKESSQLPQDVLLHIFGYLDFSSLMAALLVCWSWNYAASDNSLWHSYYTRVFPRADNSLKTNHQQNKSLYHDRQETPTPKGTAMPYIDWREAFKRSYIASSGRNIICERGYCKHCRTVVWLNGINCSNHGGAKSSNNEIKPVSPQQVVDYLLDDFCSWDSDDDDSDLDDQSVSKLWAYPRATTS
ncbi:F-box protein At5g52880 [Rhodamnia argentea]|uniref:F-box protein At5g52880 n=1 Tax=Rhodamnia argentea TaxID=178133 RepID=A0A8B8PGJ6_9MYRT|nr:F-box protein At5g52880 [Rhodamnia argentea]